LIQLKRRPAQQGDVVAATGDCCQRQTENRTGRGTIESIHNFLLIKDGTFLYLRFAALIFCTRFFLVFGIILSLLHLAMTPVKGDSSTDLWPYSVYLSYGALSATGANESIPSPRHRAKAALK
jgi:hypothetical protein